ncbi:MAG: beta-N-acetylhexosaminidase [Fervidobacterium sp.]|uniref:beta-N-acetylhexosaminidase n=1 Tax=Fervidobacterium sp. TaxID=1871331 RepID=UPI004049BFD0
MELILIPYPKIVKQYDGYVKLGTEIETTFEQVAPDVVERLIKFLERELRRLNFVLSPKGAGTLKLNLSINPDLVVNQQGYKIFVDEEISIYAHDELGLFYGLQTFLQLLRNATKIRQLQKMYIHDYPDILNRGVMLDISRDKVPKMETLKALIDKLAYLKINQLQLYTEHTFAYKNHRVVWEGYSPLTAEEVRELDEYCKERFIELVPNQNTFGHMAKWLIHDEYKHLAEAPDGFETPWGTKFLQPFSLSPAVPESIKLVDEILQELLPNFTSNKVNIGCDETFDLCQGKSKELCEKIGKGRVYLDFLLKVYNIAKRHKQTVMFWGDIIENHPELIGELPKDMIAMVWGYEANHPFDEKCKLYEQSNISFYVCPGTSTWNSFIGRSKNCIENIKNAISAAKKYHANGVLVTDWGDHGHSQHLPFSWIGFAYTSALSWNYDFYRLEDNLDHFLKEIDVNVFETDFEISKLIYSLGEITDMLPYTPNGTPFFYGFLFPERLEELSKKIEDDTLRNVLDKLENASAKLNSMKNLPDSLIKQVRNNLEFAKLGVEVIQMVKAYGKIPEVPENIWSSFEKRLREVLEDYKGIWLTEWREGGLKQSVEKLSRIFHVRNDVFPYIVF